MQNVNPRARQVVKPISLQECITNKRNFTLSSIIYTRLFDQMKAVVFFFFLCALLRACDGFVCNCVEYVIVFSVLSFNEVTRDETKGQQATRHLRAEKTSRCYKLTITLTCGTTVISARLAACPQRQDCVALSTAADRGREQAYRIAHGNMS